MSNHTPTAGTMAAIIAGAARLARLERDGLCYQCEKNPRRCVDTRAGDTCKQCHQDECAFPLLPDGTCSMFCH